MYYIHLKLKEDGEIVRRNHFVTNLDKAVDVIKGHLKNRSTHHVVEKINLLEE